MVHCRLFDDGVGQLLLPDLLGDGLIATGWLRVNGSAANFCLSFGWTHIFVSIFC
jgi:hypothetical protein